MAARLKFSAKVVAESEHVDHQIAQGFISNPLICPFGNRTLQQRKLKQISGNLISVVQTRHRTGGEIVERPNHFVGLFDSLLGEGGMFAVNVFFDLSERWTILGGEVQQFSRNFEGNWLPLEIFQPNFFANGGKNSGQKRLEGPLDRVLV